jgi:glycosyltransferase involved in cell wall biosynthesis
MSSVDVVVPCYNYAHYLKFCVDSVLSQRDVSVRVLIIDDKSTDGTPDVCRELADKDSRVTFRRHEVNQGLIGTANEGLIGWAAADYTVLLSADDALTPGSLARAVAVMNAHPEVGMTYGMSLIINEGDVHMEVVDAAKPTYQILSGPQFIRRSCEAGNPVPSPAAVVRTSVQHELGGYSPKMRHTSDMEMWMRIATRYSIGAIRETQALYRVHSSNMHLTYQQPVLGDRNERMETCLHVFENWRGAEVPGFVTWMSQMRRSFGLEAYYLAGRAFERGDEEGYRACLAFAEKYDPALTYSAVWWKLRARRLLGPGLSFQLRKAVSRLRGGPEVQSGPDWTEANLAWGQSGQEFGWWPGYGQN